ncbi:MAG TPA: serine/threonine-protein kinase [Polyangia bacterium]|nr:serine/threonine-protein kinase [Polyangia bacterium]
MPICNRCRKDWPEQYWVCPEDGTILSVARMAASGDTSQRHHFGISLDEDLRPGTTIGEYRVEGKLGEGGMASVFSAIHPLIGKKVAIKVLSRRLCADAHAVDRFIGEARTVNQIGHPNLVDIFAFGVLPDGRAYLVMEWLQGETLAERTHRQRLSAPLALDVLLQIVDALEAAHDQRVVHRDLKPQNIIVLERKDAARIKLLDFGIAKLADSDVTVPKTRSGVAMGTAGYMSPEQARGKNVDHRTDIYALGCVAYEVLLGRIPFVSDTAIDILAMHLAAVPPSPRSLWPDVPPSLERVLMQMLAKEPDGRPSLLEVRAQFEAALRSITPTMGVPAGPIPRTPKRVAAWTAAGAAVALVGAAAGARVWRRPQPAPIVQPATPATKAQVKVTPTLPATPAVAPAAAAPIKAAPKRATLMVWAPAGSSVRVDRDSHAVTVGTTPLQIDVDGGEHVVQITRGGGQHRFEQHVLVAPGAVADVRVAWSSARPGNHRANGAVTPAAPTTAPAVAATSDDPKAAPAEKAADPKPAGDYTLNPFK